MLSAADETLVNQWIAFIHEIGRVPTQMPGQVDPAHKGDLASRLETPNPALGSAPAEWDYELAPPPLVDLWKQEGGPADSSGMLTSIGQAMLDASNAYVVSGSQVSSFLTDIPALAAQGAGAIVHTAGATAWEFLAASLGFSPWWLVGTAAVVGGLVLFTDRGTTAAKRAARAGGEIARAAI